jgi:hypothetical protein
VACGDCGHPTPLHTFCAHCGVALRALPKKPRSHARPVWRRGTVFAVGLAALIGLAAGVMAAVEPDSVHGPCGGGQGCANPPRFPVAEGGRPKSWRSSLGVSLSYDANEWRVDSDTGSRLSLTFRDELALTIETSRSTEAPALLLADELSSLRGRYPDLELDPVRARQPASTAVGSVSAVGESFTGHDVDGRPVEALVEVAAARGITLVVAAWTSQQAHTSSIGLSTPFDVLINADRVLDTVRWPFEKGSGRSK